MKRTVLVFTIACMSMQFSNVKAEGDTDDFSNTSYWNALCTNTSSLTADQRNSCSAYMSYMEQQNSQLSEKISSINSQKSEIASNIQTYASNIGSYNAQINDISNMLTDLNEQLSEFDQQIADKQTQIDATQASIDQKNTEIEKLKERVRTRMSEQQGTMRFGAYLDILMGAATFSDFIRIANGLADISEKDRQTSTELQQQVEELNTLQTQLEADKADLETSKQDQQSTKNAMEERQTDLLAAQYQAQLIRDTAAEQMVEIDESATAAKSQISTNQSLISGISSSISDSQAAEAAASAATQQNQSSNSSNNESAGTADSGSSSSGGTTNISTGDSSGNPYYGGWANCTWAAWQLAHDNAGVSLPWFQGNAVNWYADAQGLGMSTGNAPAARAIAVFNSNHVAYVDQVNGSSVHIIEGNYAGLASPHERWIDASVLQGFIYL